VLNARRGPYDRLVTDRQLQALVVDWYGVMTQDLDTALGAWAQADGISYSSWREAMRDWFGVAGDVDATINPVHALERGELEVPDFEVELARRLASSGATVEPTGLLDRMFEHFVHAPDMSGLLRRARLAGLSTALLSNSWGDSYLRDGWDEMFDVVVISGEVGMRKPEPRIFRFVVERLGRQPDECVFVDDHDVNVRAAAELGLVGLHHQDYAATAAELEALFEVPLAR
jgi:putative hydrolase of the HAD superfamily